MIIYVIRKQKSLQLLLILIFNELFKFRTADEWQHWKTGSPMLGVEVQSAKWMAGNSNKPRQVRRLIPRFARVAQCVTAGWRIFSHYCRPLRQYDVFWAQRSTDRRADSTRCTQTSVYSARTKYLVRHWTSREVSLRHSSGWGTEAFPLSSVICAPVP